MFGQRLSSLSREAFKSQVRALIQLKQCEDAHLGEEVERHWFEVVTQQYVFTRLSKEVRTTQTYRQKQLNLLISRICNSGCMLYVLLL